jgi:ParB-like chromosome segregation protein Spo0J
MHWQQALEQLEVATARLASAAPGHTALIEDALDRRQKAIAALEPADQLPPEALDGLGAALELGARAATRLKLAREQARADWVRLRQESFRLRALHPAAEPVAPLIDCAG